MASEVGLGKKHEAMRRNRKRVCATVEILLAAIAWGACSFSAARAQAAASTTATPTIMWSGIPWHVTSGMGINPGPNNWSRANAFVDANGDLHLAITKVNGTWYCGEVWTDV